MKPSRWPSMPWFAHIVWDSTRFCCDDVAVIEAPAAEASGFQAGGGGCFGLETFSTSCDVTG